MLIKDQMLMYKAAKDIVTLANKREVIEVVEDRQPLVVDTVLLCLLFSKEEEDEDEEEPCAGEEVEEEFCAASEEELEKTRLVTLVGVSVLSIALVYQLAL